jgi:phage/plasmid primase-like uncharacterized protein
MADITATFPGGFNAALYPPEPAFDRYAAIAEFTEELRAAGALISGYAIANGEIHRVKHKDDKSGTKDAWYVLYEHPDFISGCFGHWKNPDARTTWTSFNHAEMSFQQRQDYAVAMEAARVRQEEERKRVHDEVAAQCGAEYGAYPGAPETHPYLQKKQVSSVPGLKFDGLIDLIVPMINEHGEIRNLQRINFDGKKLFEPSGEVKGCFFVIAGSESLILSCEGLATGISLHMASGATVYVAFNAGNLPAVTAIARRQHPNAKLIVCGDNDRFTKNAKGELMNTGALAAKKAANAGGPDVIWTVPTFSDQDTESSDFNDVHVRYGGIEHVKAELDRSIGENENPAIITPDALESLPADLQDNQSGKANANSFPERLLTTPGLVGRLAEYITQSAHRPQNAFSIAAALQIVSAASMNRYRVAPYNTGLNLYIAIVGDTGCGKDHPRTAIKHILSSLETPVRAVESIASSAALLRGLIDNRNTLVWLPDELGLYLKVAFSNKGPANDKELLKDVMTFYAIANGIHGGKTYSDRNNNIDPIVNPFLSVLGATTNEELTGSLSGAQIDNGFANRFLYVKTDQARPPKQIPRRDLPNEVLDHLNRLHRSAAPSQGNLQGVYPIEMTTEAQKILDAFDHECDEKLNVGGMGKLWVRGFDNALRVAGVIALGDSQPFLLPKVKIKPEHAELAVILVSWCIQSMEDQLIANMADSEFEALYKKVFGIIKKASLYDDKKFNKHLSEGWMPRSKLLKLIKIQTYELDRAIDYLDQSGQIQICEGDVPGIKDIKAYRYRAVLN